MATITASEYEKQIAEEGFAIVEGVLDAQHVESLRAAIAALPVPSLCRRRSGRPATKAGLLTTRQRLI